MIKMRQNVKMMVDDNRDRNSQSYLKTDKKVRTLFVRKSVTLIVESF